MATVADRFASVLATQAERVRGASFRFGTSADGTLAGYRMDIARYAKQNPQLAVRMARSQRVAFELSAADVNAWALSLLRLAYAPLAEAFERETLPVVEHALGNWPIKTGASKDLIGVGLRHETGEVRFIMAAGAPYSWFIRYAGAVGDARYRWRKEAAAIVRRVMAGFRFDGKEAQPMIGEPPFWVYRYVAGNMTTASGGHPDPQAIREAWARRDEKAPPEYRLPSGATASGEHAWTEQVYRPGMAAAERMAAAWVSAVERAA